MLGMGWAVITVVCLGLAGVSGDKIIDGREALPKSRPYMAFLEISIGIHKSACGGALILPNVVLTAAHCKGRNITVILGAHNRTTNEKSQQVIPVQEMIPHEEFDETFLDNDIMLLKLQSHATITDEVKTIRLAGREEHFQPGTTCSVAGWGLTVTDGAGSDVLREVDVSLQRHCNIANPALQICARGTGRKGTCNGDSGGPLVCRGRNNIPTAAGIVSFSNTRKCEDRHRSNVYAKVSAYREWIKSKIDILLDDSSRGRGRSPLLY
ncbi:mast cell protease 1A-like [Erpetoichthys calabaricus]|uniref:trypsin n=1 Tax=Erpetoichthys calabaricus TaxID=27687 RepID=A0A8C4TB87_ERPCA|nr:mast cell protease 1A-like [Erpetoichthys calabaricus]